MIEQVKTRWARTGLGQPEDNVRLLVPASPSIEAAAAEQKHDNDDDEKSCHIHDGGSFALTFGKFDIATSRRTWLLVGARAAAIISLARPALRP